ncbi:hypothetical protein VP01_1508g1 [Puccinia sorghi]|uniref:Uncharacterized protein n=1 Tax=Puccinia sorghi TaxID=27349 RepID=A0A0L6VJI3_9BASI|nr:hypothetical protein VP01_1508g1 [Puccinia sorghi]
MIFSPACSPARNCRFSSPNSFNISATGQLIRCFHIIKKPHKEISNKSSVSFDTPSLLNAASSRGKRPPPSSSLEAPTLSAPDLFCSLILTYIVFSYYLTSYIENLTNSFSTELYSDFQPPHSFNFPTRISTRQVLQLVLAIPYLFFSRVKSRRLLLQLLIQFGPEKIHSCFPSSAPCRHAQPGVSGTILSHRTYHHCVRPSVGRVPRGFCWDTVADCGGTGGSFHRRRCVHIYIHTWSTLASFVSLHGPTLCHLCRQASRDASEMTKSCRKLWKPLHTWLPPPLSGKLHCEFLLVGSDNISCHVHIGQASDKFDSMIGLDLSHIAVQLAAGHLGFGSKTRLNNHHERREPQRTCGRPSVPSDCPSYYSRRENKFLNFFIARSSAFRSLQLATSILQDCAALCCACFSFKGRSAWIQVDLICRSEKRKKSTDHIDLIRALILFPTIFLSPNISNVWLIFCSSVYFGATHRLSSPFSSTTGTLVNYALHWPFLSLDTVGSPFLDFCHHLILFSLRSAPPVTSYISNIIHVSLGPLPPLLVPFFDNQPNLCKIMNFLFSKLIAHPCADNLQVTAGKGLLLLLDSLWSIKEASSSSFTSFPNSSNFTYSYSRFLHPSSSPSLIYFLAFKTMLTPVEITNPNITQPPNQPKDVNQEWYLLLSPLMRMVPYSQKQWIGFDPIIEGIPVPPILPSFAEFKRRNPASASSSDSASSWGAAPPLTPIHSMTEMRKDDREERRQQKQTTIHHTLTEENTGEKKSARQKKTQEFRRLRLDRFGLSWFRARPEEKLHGVLCEQRDRTADTAAPRKRARGYILTVIPYQLKKIISPPGSFHVLLLIFPSHSSSVFFSFLSLSSALSQLFVSHSLCLSVVCSVPCLSSLFWLFSLLSKTVNISSCTSFRIYILNHLYRVHTAISTILFILTTIPHLHANMSHFLQICSEAMHWPSKILHFYRPSYSFHCFLIISIWELVKLFHTLFSNLDSTLHILLLSTLIP